MPAKLGRKVTLTWNGVEIPGVREKNLTLNGEAVDVTSDDDDGHRKLLSEAAENQVGIALSGVTKSTILKDAWFAGLRTGNVVMTYEHGGVVTGQFFLQNYSDGVPYNDAITFQAELLSTGETDYAPGSTGT